jgi:hypothetical protein
MTLLHLSGGAQYCAHGLLAPIWSVAGIHKPSLPNTRALWLETVYSSYDIHSTKRSLYAMVPFLSIYWHACTGEPSGVTLSCLLTIDEHFDN